jgi:phage shock protein C
MKNLYRSSRHRIISGVCGGLAEYLGVSVSVVRLVVLLLGFVGSGIVLYIAGMILIPQEPYTSPADAANPTASPAPSARPSDTVTFSFGLGLLLIVIGSLFLLDRLDVFNLHSVWHMTRNVMVPSLIILLGIAILMRRNRAGTQTGSQQGGVPLEQAPLPGGQWMRSRTDRRILGVCGGIAKALNVDTTVVRLAWVLLSIHSLGLGLLIYFILAIVLPEEPLPAST